MQPRVVPLSITDRHNILLVIGVIGTVIFLPEYWREGIQITLTAISLWLTPVGGEQRKGNQLSFAPIKEVGILFAGIFITMVPALEILNAYGGQIGLNSEAIFYFVTGGLSAVLDNAPNFMVHSIAEKRGVKMPSSFGYLLWSVPILGTILVINAWWMDWF